MHGMVGAFRLHVFSFSLTEEGGEGPVRSPFVGTTPQAQRGCGRQFVLLKCMVVDVVR